MSAHSAGFGVYKYGGGLRCITFVPITIATMRNLLRRSFCAGKAWHKKTASINSPVAGVKDIMVEFELESGEQLHAEAPDTFWIPPLDARQSLSSGDIVKLVFRIEEGGEVNVERMWVVVKKATTEGYVGILDNDPYCTDQIQAGLELEFAPKHIIDIYADD